MTELQQGAPDSMNASRTCTESGAKSAHDVLETFPPQLKQHMRILRKKFGASSKIGRRASNVEEALINLPAAEAIGPVVEFQRTNLEKSIKRWLTEIHGMLAA